MSMASAMTKMYIVEHLDPELGPWSSLEYATIARECSEVGASFCLTSVPKTLEVPDSLRVTRGFAREHRSVEEICTENKSRVCLLDPAATQTLSPEDAKQFDVFLFGGILGK